MFPVKQSGSMAKLPPISAEELSQRIEALSPEPLGEGVVEALYVHYQELRRWSGGLALIGKGTTGEVLERHFGESLAALPLVPSTPPAGGEGRGVMVDVGSGAGFPGLVLAAARPGWDVVLVEARQRKWAFLMSVTRKGALSCRCLNARVGDPLPEGLPGVFDLLTARAIRLPTGVLGPLLERLSAAGRALFWAGGADPDLPAGWTVSRELHLPGSEHRRILEVRRDTKRHDTETLEPEPSP